MRLALLWIVAAFGLAAPATPQTLSMEQRREDLQVMMRALTDRHPGIHHFTPRERLDASVAALSARLAELNDDQFLVEMNRITAAVGDAHTFVDNGEGEHQLPMVIARFGSEFRIAGVQPGYERALGARLIAIGSTPIAQAFETALELAARNEHAALREAWTLGFLRRGTLLHGLGITASNRQARLRLQGDDGAEFELEMLAVPPAGRGSWLWAAAAPMPARAQPASSFYCLPLAEGQALYCNVRTYQDLGRHSREMFARISRLRPRKVIIDLRQQTIGGDYHVGRRHLVRPWRELPDLNRPDRLFVLTSPVTFSAAMVNVLQFGSETNATLVGQALGEKPNSYSEVAYRTLPNSRWRLHYSTGYYEYAPGGENRVRPDVEIVPSWEDFRAGRDAALEWVLARP